MGVRSMVKSMKEYSYGRSPVFDSGLELVEKCDEIDGDTVHIHMPSEVYSKIQALMDIVDTEWMGYFTGKRVGNEAYIEDMVIPEQEVGVASGETEAVSNTIGLIHSHNSMSARHSHVDNDGASLQHGFSIVANKDMDFEAVGRMKTPCGRYARIQAEVTIEFEAYYEEWAKETKDDKLKIKRRRTRAGDRLAKYHYGAVGGMMASSYLDESEPEWVIDGSFRRTVCPECGFYTMLERIPVHKYDDKYCENCDFDE